MIWHPHGAKYIGIEPTDMIPPEKGLLKLDGHPGVRMIEPGQTDYNVIRIDPDIYNR